MAKKNKRTFIRVDATVGTAERKIATDYGLPQGSIKLSLPNGRKARKDKLIGSFLRDWDCAD